RHCCLTTTTPIELRTLPLHDALPICLEHQGIVVGANVLDLYAGSGAVGLEAASRGAERVTLVESSRDAVEVCRRNATNLGLDDQDRKSTRLNSSHVKISYAVFCLKKK